MQKRAILKILGPLKEPFSGSDKRAKIKHCTSKEPFFLAVK